MEQPKKIGQVLRPTPYVGAAILFAAIALAIGGYMFQASALSFEYMKLRQFALFESSSSLPLFGQRFAHIAEILGTNRDPYIEGLRDRAFLEANLPARQQAVGNLTGEAVKLLRMTVTDPKFLDVESAFRSSCAAEDNAGADALLSSSGLDALKLPAASGANPVTTPTVVAACKISKPACTATPDGAASLRTRLICAQAAVVDAQKRQDEFRSDKFYAAALRLDYPGITDESATEAVRVAEAYLTIACGPGMHCLGANYVECGKAKPQKPGCITRSLLDRTRFHVWNWWLGWPLAIIYLFLALFFGMLGGLALYLYRSAFARETAVVTPQEGAAADEAAPPPDAPPPQTQKAGPSKVAGPLKTDSIGGLFEPILSGGGAAIVVLLLVMAGFQFLTVGTSQPDLAYPNPLTVCAISVLSGISGRNVLKALQDFAGRVFGHDAEHKPRPAA